MGYKKKLYEAIGKNDIESVEDLINNGEINETNINSEYQGQTLLHWASFYGHKEVIEILITKGAEVNNTNNDGDTPLHYAAKNGKKEMVEILIANGATVNNTNIFGNTPLHYAARYGHKDTLEILIANGAPVNITNVADETPLHYAAQCRNKSTTEILIAHGAKIDVADNIGETPLHWPARTGDKEMAKILIQANADLNIVNKFDTTPLAYSFEFGSTEVAIELINHGAYLTKDQALEMRLKKFFNKLDFANDVKGFSKADLALKLLSNTLSNFLKTGFEHPDEFVKPINETSGVDLNGKFLKTIIKIMPYMKLRAFSTLKNFKAASADSDVDAKEEEKDNQQSKFNADENDPQGSPAILSNDERDKDVRDIISAQLSIQSFDDDLGSALIGQD